MVPFKAHFLGLSPPPSPRVATSQRCLRSSGKHNDLSNVGFTERHHTFFEMLGNFAFDDVDKAAAIAGAWRFVTGELGIDQRRLRVTVHHSDAESRRAWEQVTGWSGERSAERIVSMGDADNWWAMGDVGPCGPCTEIFVDQGEGRGGDERWLEIWNLVFMQHERLADGSNRPLPQRCLDTGMGLERLASVLQDVGSNYDIDLFRPIVRAASELILSQQAASAQAGAASSSLLSPRLSSESLAFLRQWTFNRSHPLSASFAVLLDHLRSVAFLYADGLLPSNTHRGYVLRRILRRCLTHGHMLGLSRPFLHSLYPALEEAMGAAYPELTARSVEVISLMHDEEKLFYSTLSKGLRMLEEELKRGARRGGARVLSGEAAFALYDSCGFPLDLTEMIINRHGWSVDQAGFDALMAQQRETSRAAWTGSGDAQLPRVVTGWGGEGVRNLFTGYEKVEEEVEVKRVAQGDDGISFVVVDPCPFYATGGGQVSDTGWLHRPGSGGAEQRRWEVLECVRVTDSLSLLRLSPGTPISVGDRLSASVDADKRRRTAAHHTSTHLLHSALRSQLRSNGRLVQQAGSLVSHDRFRFDFSYPSPVPLATLRSLESAVNDLARAALPVTHSTVKKAKADEEGAIGLFSDKYGEDVRVVRVGSVSAELCGGTHAHSTSECFPFVILSEGSVSAGIRRIEGVSGQAAVQLLLQGWDALRDIAGGGVKVHVADAPKAVQRTRDELSAQRDAVKALRKQLVGRKDWKTIALSFSSSLGPRPTTVYAVPAADAASVGDLRADALVLAAKASGVHVLLCTDNGHCAVSGAWGAVEEVWDALMTGLQGKGGKGGGSGGLMQGRLPCNDHGGVDMDEALRALTSARTAVADPPAPYVPVRVHASS